MVTPTNQHGQSFLARVKVKSEKRSSSSPGYWIFPGQKWETKEVKSQAGAGAKLGAKGGSKGRDLQEVQAGRCRDPPELGCAALTASPRAGQPSLA